jgi:hypothetical protein
VKVVPANTVNLGYLEVFRACIQTLSQGYARILWITSQIYSIALHNAVFYVTCGTESAVFLFWHVTSIIIGEIMNLSPTQQVSSLFYNANQTSKPLSSNETQSSDNVNISDEALKLSQSNDASWQEKEQREYEEYRDRTFTKADQNPTYAKETLDGILTKSPCFCPLPDPLTPATWALRKQNESEFYEVADKVYEQNMMTYHKMKSEGASDADILKAVWDAKGELRKLHGPYRYGNHQNT